MTTAPGRTRTAFFGFGEVRHLRLRPVHHAMRYRAFFVRVPAAALAAGASGNWAFGINRRALISVHASDHGAGGDAVAWVRSVLDENAIPADGPCFLHAFPRVLGYAFRPVSFWFCHDRAGSLRAVLAEVNNTFGERHCYLLARPDVAPIGNGSCLSAPKAFHVSPFCRIEGHYRFRFVNRPDRALARIDYDDADGALLRTSLSGRLAPATRANVARALLGYPLFTLGVIARIHWQALRLWARRVPYHRKPAAPASFVTRDSA